MFKRQERQRIINDYLNTTGRNQFVPREFLEWLKDQPEHEVYATFYGMDDAQAAQAHREQMVRQWVSGLRISVLRSDPERRTVGGVVVQEYRLPMMVSPVAGRHAGGGYEHTDPDDPAHRVELLRQASAALAAWIERFEGAALLHGIDVSSAKEIVGSLEAAGVAQAA